MLFISNCMFRLTPKRLWFWLIFYSAFASAQYPISSKWRYENWSAQWIAHPTASPKGYGVYCFQKEVEFSDIASPVIVHVSADNRYKLYLNGVLVSLGPARGDITHWKYESLDLQPYLKKGRNRLTAVVWNEGQYQQEAQISHQTGFILQGNTDRESILNTNSSWKVQQDLSYQPLPFRSQFYYVAGPGEIRNLAKQIDLAGSFDDSGWIAAKSIGWGVPKELQGPYGTVGGWMLVPSELPPMEMTPERMVSVVVREGGAIQIPAEFPKEKTSITIPAHSQVSFLFDQGYLTNAYPVVEFSQGRGASLTLRYAEALYTQFPSKGNRNEIAGKVLVGRADSLLSAGASHQRFTPLAYRTYRYLQLTIQTSADPLILQDVSGIFTGYPFHQRAIWAGGTDEMSSMLDIGWRTARLCALDTYMDCPYYEQLQYIGDGRIQALVSMFISGDDRLVKNALTQADQSRQPEGITLSRHPSMTPQYIPTFSLWYIGMLHDYSRYGADLAFVRDKLPGMRQVLAYFQRYQLPNGSLKQVPHWMFTDWVDGAKEWKAGVGPVGQDGTSALFDLTLLYALQKAADLEKGLGQVFWAQEYEQAAQKLAKTIRKKYWDPNRNLWADREEKDTFSQHTNALAILTGLETSPRVARSLVTDTRLAPASIYFKYYLHQALIQAGLGNEYMTWLDKWRENMAMGLTTWAEKSNVDQSRSDCHAWGASPNIEFYRTVLGIDSDGLAFSRVKINPHLGDLTQVAGSIPHPNGMIKVSYERIDGTWRILVELPSGVDGTLVWAGKTRSLKPGKNQFNWAEK